MKKNLWLVDRGLKNTMLNAIHYITYMLPITNNAGGVLFGKSSKVLEESIHMSYLRKLLNR